VNIFGSGATKEMAPIRFPEIEMRSPNQPNREIKFEETLLNSVENDQGESIYAAVKNSPVRKQ
jgi:hypothetical protein